MSIVTCRCGLNAQWAIVTSLRCFLNKVRKCITISLKTLQLSYLTGLSKTEGEVNGKGDQHEDGRMVLRLIVHSECML